MYMADLLEWTSVAACVNGSFKSALWPVVLANVFGQTVDDLEDVGVKGAATLAGKWLGWHETLTPANGKGHVDILERVEVQVPSRIEE